MRTIKLSPIPLALLGAALALTGGCEFFEGDDEIGDETGTSEDGGERPPSQGFRVFPKYMLQDVPAIVALGEGGGFVPCEPDEELGGYLCDAGSLPPGSGAVVQVERDGFEPATRELTVFANNLIELDVHLLAEGNPAGAWSPCVATGEFETCDELCASVGSTCAVTSCASEDLDSPIATHETFHDAACSEGGQGFALACTQPLPGTGVLASVRCCCAS